MANKELKRHIPGVDILDIQEFSDWHRVKPLFDIYGISFFLPFSSQTPFQSADDILDYALSGNIAALVHLDNLLDYRENCGHDLITIAAYAGHLQLIKYLHIKGLPLEQEFPLGLTPLLAATSQRHLETVTWLVQNGVSINASNNEGTSALHVAALAGNLEISTDLLKNGALVDSVDKEGRTALMAACQKGHHLVVNVLLSHDADAKKSANCGKSAPHYAVTTGNHKCLSLLIDADNGIINCYDDQDWYLLTVAVYHGSLDVVDFMVSLGADVNAQDKYGRTALMAASEAGHSDIAKYLLFHNATVSLRSTSGVSAFDIAIADDMTELAQVMSSQLDVDSKDCMGNTSLILASRYGNLPCVKSVMQRMTKKSLNHQNNLGISALLASCMCNGCDLTQYLLGHGADVEMKSMNGLNAYQIAFLSRSFNLVSMLQEYVSSMITSLMESMVILTCALGDTDMLKHIHQEGCDIKRASSSGIRPLMMAAYHGNKEMAKYLIENDAVIDGRNKSGLSAIVYAIEGDHHKMVDYLIGHGSTLNMLNSSGKTLCHIITQERNIGLLKEVAHLGMDINRKDNNEGVTPLMIASQNGWLDMAQELVELGANISLKCRKGHDAAMYAQMGNHTDLYQYLKKQTPALYTYNWVKRNSNISQLYLRINPPGFNACITGNVEKLKHEQSKGFKINSLNKEGLSALHLGSFYGHTDLIQWLVDHGAIANISGVVKMTPLMIACELGFYDIVDILRKHKCLLNSRTRSDCSALHYTVAGKNNNLLKYLLALGPVVDIVDDEVGTPLNLACLNGQVSAVKLLVEHGANVNKKDVFGRTPLMTAAKNGHVEVATFLIEQGADLSVVCKENKSALNYAKENGHTEMCDFLKGILREQGIEIVDDIEGELAETLGEDTSTQLSPSEQLESLSFEIDSDSDEESGLSRCDRRFLRMCDDGAELQLFTELFLQDPNVDINVRNSDGQTGLILAAKEENYAIARALVQHNVDINCRDNDGHTALMYAVSEGNLPLVKLLVEEGGADIELLDNEGNHVISVASEQGNDEVLVYLFEKREAVSTQCAEFIDKCVLGNMQEVENALENPPCIPIDKLQTCFQYAAVSLDKALLNMIMKAYKMSDIDAVFILNKCIEQQNEGAVEMLLQNCQLTSNGIETILKAISTDSQVKMMIIFFENVSHDCLVKLCGMILEKALRDSQYQMAFTVARKWTFLKESGDPMSFDPEVVGEENTRPWRSGEANPDSCSHIQSPHSGFYTPRNAASGTRCQEFQNFIIL